MKLTKVRIKNFRSIEDSNEFEISNLTCLVGKNEAGKTAILHALEGLKPFAPFEYDRSRDYPRRYLARFNERHPNGESEVVRTWWKLDDSEIANIEKELGEGVILSDIFEIWTGIGCKSSYWDLKIDDEKVLENLSSKYKLNAAEKAAIKSAKRTNNVENVLEKSQITEKQQLIINEIKTFRESRAVLKAIDLLSSRLPKFFYTSHFDRMSGEISISKLTKDKAQNTVDIGDKIFLDFLEYAGTSVEELQETGKYEELKAQCEGASNDITDEIFEFWSQNEALQVQIELGEGKPEDPAPFNSGTIAKIRIYNQYHRASIPLSERSAGFVWFFSFLAQFKQLKKTTGNAIILLDEPGLTLHGKAQSDLLRYIQERLLPDHQVIYTTHSPFMVPAEQLGDVRVVEDVIRRDERGRPEVFGTKVSSDILSVDKDTLFPLQGHLGYEITQSLFIGQNTLLVEGPSDILYLQVLSQALKDRKRKSLDSRWVICPTGGIDKIWSFASLFGGNKLNIAVLSDFAHGDKAKIQRLRESEILKTEQVLTVADFTGKSESDIEDLLHPELFCVLINAAFSLPKANKIDTKMLEQSVPKTERIVKQAETLFKTMPPEVLEFDHFSPANWLLRHPELLDGHDAIVTQTLDGVEKVFETLNSFLS